MSRSPRLRITSQKPTPGFHHPLSKTDILQFMDAVGSLARYGLRIIELRRAVARSQPGKLTFGRYEVAGRILLFEQMEPPWRLPGVLKAAETNRFKRYGASVTAELGGRMTIVEWPGDSLARFMLEEVLLHELGHHVLQHYKGKRTVRIARTKDHERFAARFAATQRALLDAARKPSS